MNDAPLSSVVARLVVPAEIDCVPLTREIKRRHLGVQVVILSAYGTVTVTESSPSPSHDEVHEPPRGWHFREKN